MPQRKRAAEQHPAAEQCGNQRVDRDIPERQRIGQTFAEGLRRNDAGEHLLHHPCRHIARRAGEQGTGMDFPAQPEHHQQQHRNNRSHHQRNDKRRDDGVG